VTGNGDDLDEPPAPGAPRPPAPPDAPPDEPWPWGPPWAQRRAWRRSERRQRRGQWRSRSHAGFFRFFGCLVAALVLAIVGFTVVATWVLGAVLGLLAPSGAPSSFLTLAGIMLVLLVAVVGFSVVAGAVGPLAELGDASERLADGDQGVRVAPRGPGPVRRLATSFNTMAERLDRSRDERRAMLADVTHELRTPLTVITGELEAMLDGVHPMDAEHVAPVLSETHVMSRLLDDLRTLSLADAGALALHREPTDLRALADEVVAAHRGRASGAGVDLQTDGPDALVTSIDPIRVREIMTNLLANALRHTPAGGRVIVQVARDGDDALLTVVDTGEGIPPEDLARVFDRFHRRADTGGSGLGLAIVRDLAAAHGGSVTVTSAGVPGRGATFVVRLPMRA
jgi:signal transduction histidine kinase